MALYSEISKTFPICLSNVEINLKNLTFWVKNLLMDGWMELALIYYF